jgi:tagaturonate reductase
MTVLGAYLYGKDTVKECMDDEMIQNYMNKGIFDEIIPTLDLPKSELEAFAAEVSKRFANPFIKHYLLSISLNSTSKFKARVLPSITEYLKRKGQLPKVLTFSLAALIAFYKGTEIQGTSLIGNRPGNTYNINDDMPVLQFFKGLWAEFDGTKKGTERLVKAVLGSTAMWGEDLNNLPGFTAAVTDYLYSILTKGVGETVKEVVA